MYKQLTGVFVGLLSTDLTKVRFMRSGHKKVFCEFSIPDMNDLPLIGPARKLVEICVSRAGNPLTFEPPEKNKMNVQAMK